MGADARRPEHANAALSPSRCRGCTARWLIVASGAALLMASLPTGSSALVSPRRLIDRSSVGGLATTASYNEAVRHFAALGASGGQASFGQGGCTLRYRGLGITLWWVGDPLTRGTPTACTHFQEAVVTGSGWHTRNGLAIGDSTNTLQRLYPRAYDTRRAGPKWSARGSIEWDLTVTCCGGGERPALSVMVKRGRIVAIFVEMVGH
jgi:hypothetical protein